MAKLRELKTRIKSVNNTEAITRTMDMIAQSKYARLYAKMENARPHFEYTMTLLRDAFLAGEINHPLFVPYENVKRVALVIFAPSRGMCGSYLLDILKRVRERHERLVAEGKSVMLYVIGKKGAEYLRAMQRGIEREYIEFTDKVKFTEMAKIPVEIISLYRNNTIQSAEAIYTRFHSRRRQTVENAPLLPISKAIFDMTRFRHPEPKSAEFYLIEPSKAALYETLVPLSVHSRLFLMMLESFVSEEAARMDAMHAAVDSAQNLAKDLRTTYNRARQSGITMEMIEIIGGSAAVME